MGIFKPAWQNNNTAKALNAVRRTKNQRQLIEIVRYDYSLDDSIKNAAYENMTQATLETLALNETYPRIRSKAVAMLHSYDTLVKIITSEIPNYRVYGIDENRVVLFALKNILHNREIDIKKKVDAVRLCDGLLNSESSFGADLFENKVVPDNLREPLGFEVRHSKDRVDGAEATWYEDRYTVFYHGKEIGGYKRSTY